MLNAFSISLTGSDDAGCQRAARSLGQQGMAPAASLEWPGGRLQAWSNPVQAAGGSTLVETAQGAACCVGPLWYRGLFGNEALRRLIEEADSPARIDESALRGNFALFLRRGERAWLLNDALGFVRIHAGGDGRFHSTSWLAARAYGGYSDIDEAAAIEYVLLGASHSDRTVARGVTTLELGHGLDLATRRPWRRFEHGLGRGGPPPASLDAAVEHLAAHLHTVFGEVAAAFPGRTAAALSGGFDSRLVLAGLLAHGERPRLFVYGDEGSADVRIARQVAQAQGLPITVVDKDAGNRALPEPDREALVRSALFLDGLPNDGIHDPGADRHTRLAQSAGGFVALNGGGGEIFRNFFHLPEGRFRTRHIVEAFYRGFDARVFRRAGGLAAYRDGLAASMGRVVDIASATADGAARALSRPETELVYPLFRCHFWMGLNNGTALRHGWFATPLVDLELVRAASVLPLAWKNAGALEARLIAALHAGVASQPSSYGFRFADGPGPRARWAEWVHGRRPVALRPLINAVRRRTTKARPHPDFVARARVLFPGEWRLDALLDLQRLPDDDAFARALSIEVVSRELAP